MSAVISSNPKPSDLAGTYQLVRWQITREGVTRYPYGEDAIGQLVYSADGYMSGTVARASRPALDAQNPRRASDAAKVAAFDSFFHYAGPFAIEGDEVVHTVALAHNPGFVGTVQRRKMSFDGDTLVLSAVDGRDHHRLTWRRAR
jgi:hypothetical protein